MGAAPRVCVVIPAHNEAPRIGEVVAGVPRRLPGTAGVEVLVVDDCSSDGTAEAARRAGAEVIRHAVNQGAGGALRTGTLEAVRRGAGIVVHMDADGQHRPEDLPRMVAPLLAGADAVAGARPFRRPMPFLFIFGNRVLSLATNVMFGLRVSDTQCGYRAFWAGSLPSLLWDSGGYAFASEMLIRGHANGVRWTEVPIKTIYLDPRKGTGVRAGVRILGALIGWRLRPAALRAPRAYPNPAPTRSMDDA